MSARSGILRCRAIGAIRTVTLAELLRMRVLPPTFAARSPGCAVRRALAVSLLVLAGLASPLHAQGARDYVVELVLFEHRGAQAPGKGTLWAPAPRAALTLGTERAAAAGFVPLDMSRQLDGDVRAMNASGRYRVLEHLLWRQPGLARNEAVRIDIAIGPPVRLYIDEAPPGEGAFLPAALAPRPDRALEITTATLSGTLKLRLGRFLHLESQLVYTDPDAQRSYRLNESRKMRRNELHYIDNPRFGLLTRVRRAEDVPSGEDVLPVESGATAVDQDIQPDGVD